MKWGIFLVLSLVLAIAASAMPNPAATNCIARGMRYEIVVHEDGSESGVCIGKERIDEWELLKNDIRSEILRVEGPIALSSAPEAELMKQQMLSVSVPLDIPLSATPSYLNWSDNQSHDYITPVKNQGSCGSCWAFATVANAEARIRIGILNSTYPISLSEQYLVSCDKSCYPSPYNNYCQIGCSGGYLDLALEYFATNGITRTSCFPYQEEDVPCEGRCAGWEEELVRIDYGLVANNRDAVRTVLANHGPVMAGIWACNAFQSYTSGIFSDDSMTGCGGHAVLITGYNDSGQYWIVKNSWGTSWGDNGYIRISYSEDEYDYSDWYYKTNKRVLDLSTPLAITATDLDSDGRWDGTDNCFEIPNADQADQDSDSVGDACDSCPAIPGFSQYAGCPDTYPPVVSSITLSDYIVRTNTSVLVTVNATDIISMRNVTAEGIILTRAGDIWAGSIPLSSPPLNITSTDVAGNIVRNNSIIYILDDTPPAVSGVRTNQSVAIGLQGETDVRADVLDANILNVSVIGNGTYLLLSNASFRYNRTVSPSQLGFYASGNYTLNIIAIDEAGNANSTETTSILVDASPPQVSGFSSTSYNAKSTDILNFSVFVNDSSSVVVSMNGTAMSGTNGGIYSTLNSTSDFGCYGSGNCTFYVTAADSLGNINNQSSLTIQFDDISPVIHSFSSSDLVVNSSQLFTLAVNASDLHLSNVTVNGVLLSSGSIHSITVNATMLGCSEGDCILAAVATDAAGNSNTSTLTIIVDDSPPSIGISSPSNNSWVNTLTPRFNITFWDGFSDNASCTVTIGSKSVTQTINRTRPTIFSTSGTGLSNTNYTWTATCTDLAGNVAVNSSIVGIDTIPPTSSATANQTANTNGWHRTSVKVNISSTDASSGIARIEWRPNSSVAWRTATSDIEINSTLAENIFYYRAVDNAGNIEPERQLSLKLDTTAPVIGRTAMQGNATPGMQVYLEAFATDPNLASSLLFSVNGTNGTITFTSGRYYGSFTAPGEGTHILTINVSDKAGNSAIQTREISVNATLPSIIVPLHNGTRVMNSTNMTVAFVNANNGGSIECSATSGGEGEGGGWGCGGAISYSGPINVEISGSEGEKNISFYANNSVGMVWHNNTYMIDATQPWVSILSPINGTKVNGSLPINYYANDASGIASASLYIDSVLISSGISNFSYPTTLLADGLHTITITVTDKVGYANSTISIVNVSNSVPTVILVQGDFSSGAGRIDDLSHAPARSVIYSLEGLNSSDASISIPDVTKPAVLQSMFGKINITADTSSGSRVYFLIPSSSLSQFSPPYSGIKVYADHGAGIVGPLESSYDSTFTIDNIEYARFYFLTDDFSMFYWGEPVEEDDDGGGGGGGGSDPPATRSSGGGAGGGAVTSSMKETLSLKGLGAGDRASFMINSSDLLIRSIEMTMLRDKPYISIIIEGYDDKPDDVADLDDFLLYYRIRQLNFEDTDVRNISFTLRVPRSHLKEEQEFAFFHWEDGWEQLDTELISEDEDWRVIKARSPGFSYFAVASIAKEPEETFAELEPAIEENQTTAPSPMITAEVIEPFEERSFPWFALLAGIIAFAAVSLWLLRGLRR